PAGGLTGLAGRVEALDGSLGVSSPEGGPTIVRAAIPAATEAARSFSDVLNRVASGEVVEVTRSGAPVAVIAPPRARLLSAERFRALMASAPRPDDAFAADVQAARDNVGAPGEPWPS
ncbi:MAG: type II toxin-antitoxin system prevent-host-death family antitoxin, partial [Vicinamibacteria bacterium]